jgi:hypothetical protein
MYTIFSNEKLGMPVEQQRLEEMRRDIAAQRLAGEVQGRRFTLIHALSRVVTARKLRLSVLFAFRIKHLYKFRRASVHLYETRL